MVLEMGMSGNFDLKIWVVWEFCLGLFLGVELCWVSIEVATDTMINLFL